MSSGNVLFLVISILGPLVSVSSSSWIICWVGLELSFLGVIPLLLSDTSYSSLSKEAVVKYFCVQALGSAFLMLGGCMVYSSFYVSWLFYSVFFLGLFMKLGLFPMHFWVPSVVSGLSWFPIFLLLGWQKLPPFALLINFSEYYYWFSPVLLIFGGLSALVGAVIGLNQSSFRAMLGSSSIAHTGWVCLGVVYGGVWIYFGIYCTSLILLMVFSFLGDELLVSMSILGLSGLPPFLMFIGKWSVLKSALESEAGFGFLILPLVGALLSLFFYLKFFYSFYLKFSESSMNSKYSFVSSIIFIILGGVFSVSVF
uniref:NADH-ubiquinone oxidoreductase chain 2 n=1 Tax=Dendrodoris krusensternii TaxID=3032029 RepID=A0AAF1C6W0_9GAST|nr:NADH dehydrogenase subunit 2 [Dendrodoris krusensternii]WPH63916.1 NADH dehydrogenase subunit 2 [Dendrodoris krusensternii]